MIGREILGGLPAGARIQARDVSLRTETLFAQTQVVEVGAPLRDPASERMIKKVGTEQERIFRRAGGGSLEMQRHMGEGTDDTHTHHTSGFDPHRPGPARIDWSKQNIDHDIMRIGQAEAYLSQSGRQFGNAATRRLSDPKHQLPQRKLLGGEGGKEQPGQPVGLAGARHEERQLMHKKFVEIGGDPGRKPGRPGAIVYPRELRPKIGCDI